MVDLSALRQSKLKQRRALTPEFIEKAETKISEKLISLPSFQQAKDIAFYIPINNEVPTNAMITHALNRGKHVYLPVVKADYSLDFIRYMPNDPMTINNLGIAEPKSNKGINLTSLSLVIVPGIVFSPERHRLGYGKGCYDRSFASLNAGKVARNQKTRPQFVGLAYECQISPSWPTRSHDINMNFVLTQKTIY